MIDIRNMDRLCKDSNGYLNASMFNAWTCSLCYIYLFLGGKLKFYFNMSSPGLINVDDNSHSNNIRELKSSKYICDSLGEQHCRRWNECCKAADNCCQHQLKTRISSLERNLCPRTWDGLKCFDDTDAGTSVKFSCPGYMKDGNMQGHGVKDCTERGTWAILPISGKEWTNYTGCTR